MLDVAHVAWFYARNGNYVEIIPYQGATQSTIELYLNGSIYGAILHQRKMLPLHGSCFQYGSSGIMISGESGVGKSSLTTSFCLHGAKFLTDDVTPIALKGGRPYIWGVSDRVKLWSDSLHQLKHSEVDLQRIMPEQGKYYFPMKSANGAFVPLRDIFIVQIHNKDGVSVKALKGVEKFAALRQEIYRQEYLSGMAESERAYVAPLIRMSQTVRVTEVTRPATIPIDAFRISLEKIIAETMKSQEVAA